jgi:hypothetical protein
MLDVSVRAVKEVCEVWDWTSGEFDIYSLLRLKY